MTTTDELRAPPGGGGVGDPGSRARLQATTEAFAAGLDDGFFGLPPTRADSYPCRGAYCHGYAYGRGARGPEAPWTWAALNPN